MGPGQATNNNEEIGSVDTQESPATLRAETPVTEQAPVLDYETGAYNPPIRDESRAPPGEPTKILSDAEEALIEPVNTARVSTTVYFWKCIICCSVTHMAYSACSKPSCHETRSSGDIAMTVDGRHIGRFVGVNRVQLWPRGTIGRDRRFLEGYHKFPTFTLEEFLSTDMVIDISSLYKVPQESAGPESPLRLPKP